MIGDRCPVGHTDIRTRSDGHRFCAPCRAGRERNRRSRVAELRPPFQRPTAEDRFWSKVLGGDVEQCWLWTASKDRKGYGRFHRGGPVTDLAMAHRWAYEQLITDIPEGLELDHLCRTPSCVNPWHCEPVTREVNLARTAGFPQPRKRGNTNACGPRRSRPTTATL